MVEGSVLFVVKEDVFMIMGWFHFHTVVELRGIWKKRRCLEDKMSEPYECDRCGGKFEDEQLIKTYWGEVLCEECITRDWLETEMRQMED